MFYNADNSGGWQLLEEHIHDTDVPTNPPGAPITTYDRHMQYVWGMRYIDDIVLRRQDSSGNGTFDTTWYHLTDTLFSTVAILDDAANLVERVSYTAYGYARHHHPGDLTGDGAVTSDDVNAMAGLGVWGVGDITRTGAVNGTDQSIVGTQLRDLPAGRISTTDNIIGYAGYIFNAEIHGGGLYTVRHRHYSPELGRWFTRDPIGYVDGMSMYEYVRGMPLRFADATGLSPCGFFHRGSCMWVFDSFKLTPDGIHPDDVRRFRRGVSVFDKLVDQPYLPLYFDVVLEAAATNRGINIWVCQEYRCCEWSIWGWRWVWKTKDSHCSPCRSNCGDLYQKGWVSQDDLRRCKRERPRF